MRKVLLAMLLLMTVFALSPTEGVSPATVYVYQQKTSSFYVYPTVSQQGNEYVCFRVEVTVPSYDSYYDKQIRGCKADGTLYVLAYGFSNERLFDHDESYSISTDELPPGTHVIFDRCPYPIDGEVDWINVQGPLYLICWWTDGQQRPSNYNVGIQPVTYDITCTEGWVGDPYCKTGSNDVWRNYIDSECRVSEQKYQDCGPAQTCVDGQCGCIETWIGNPYCKQSDPHNVYRTKQFTDCSTQELVYEQCGADEICLDGSCVPAGGGEWFGEPYCKAGDLSKVYRVWKNPDGTTEERVYTTCASNEQCQNGQCVPISEGGEEGGGIPLEAGLVIAVAVTVLLVLAYLFYGRKG